MLRCTNIDMSAFGRKADGQLKQAAMIADTLTITLRSA
jgi:hypothetical protein